METKPVPKPRSILTDRPIPAPRRLAPTMSTSPTDYKTDTLCQETSISEKSDEKKSSATSLNSNPDSNSTNSNNSLNNNEFFRSLSTSSRQLKDEISEKMTVKGRAVISSTRNASIRLERSVKNLLARRLTSLSQEVDKKVARDPIEEDRCVSLPANDIFRTISFYSPLNGNLKSVAKQEDLSSSPQDARQSPPPPVYPPPPLPDESIYDELQSVTSGSSGRYDTLGSTFSDSVSDSFDLLGFARRQASDSDQSLNLSDVNLTLSTNEKREATRKLSRSDSWTFYDTTPAGKSDGTDELDAISSAEEEIIEKETNTRTHNTSLLSGVSNESRLSLQNSIYDNFLPAWRSNENVDDRETTLSPQTDIRERENQSRKEKEEEEVERRLKVETKDRSTDSVLIEFDPFARKPDENVYGNYENNDLMLLEALLATNDSPANTGSTVDLREELDDEETIEEATEEDSTSLAIPVTPPEPPKRYDSLPKSEYDELEAGQEDSTTAKAKNPPLLPKLAHLARRKQPAVPPRKPSIKTYARLDGVPAVPAKTTSSSNQTLNSSSSIANSTTSTPSSTSFTGSVTGSAISASITSTSNTTGTTSTTTSNVNEIQESGMKNVEETRRTGMMQKLRKLRQESSTHAIKPHVMNLMKTGGKLLSRNREQSIERSASRPSSSLILERPKVPESRANTTHRGVVYRTGAGIERAKDLVPRAAVLSDRKVSFYTDKSMSTLKEVAQLDTIYSVHLLQDVKIVDGEMVHCVAISGEGRPSVHVFYAKGINERRIWAQRILEAITPIFPTKYTADLTRVGWAYLKEGVTGTWFPAWLLLQHRTLIYTKSLDPVVFEELDLRKGRCIVLREEEGPNPAAGHVPVVVVDAGGTAGGALHVAVPVSREGPAWRHALHQAATNCGPALDQQQLTQDNVPVILDKCINFIYAHGIMSEGIYRRSGSSSAVVRLLEAFRRDAWATQITKGSYSEHDVATALRRFLRDLPDPLFPANIHDKLCHVSEITNEDEKISGYRKLLSILNPVTSATARRILAHLHTLSKQSGRNLMTIENLSAIWGPTLMHASENSAEDWNRSETKVIGDLIRLYPRLYQLSSADLAKEAKMLEVLERHHISNNGLRGAPSGDLKIWIYLLSKDGECVNVTISPQKTAFDVCQELSEKAALAAHELCLEECTLSGALERPLHHTERVLEAVARWGYWDPEDRKDNVLILKKDRLYKDIVPLVKPPMTISGELKFADTKMKHFKNYLFEFSQAKLCYYKDKVCSVKLHEWKIEDIIWYLGYEPKRNPQMGWSITFIEKNKKPTRLKDSPYFGNTLAGAAKNEQFRWIAAMLFGEYQLNLRPSAVNLMDP